MTLNTDAAMGGVPDGYCGVAMVNYRRRRGRVASVELMSTRSRKRMDAGEASRAQV
ncbi:hypothetical protein CERSUDRAFT_81073 [Gelatoporia subvermispora B]|uniref:Uncharacterized protein n=1 Tax=Ceriporiopsis subvermispora (strain B) TaxID=914234 RepID=M2QRH9_CERS8|nr:hypothetical protein CERSUDRAFT_81073 [Gelatoporia subvermispora B]